MTKGEIMTFANKFAAGAGAVGLSLFAALPAWAQEAAPAVAEAAAPTPDKGDTAWMMTATVLVMAMIVPGLALFYGGLVRTKNMLSVLTQIIAVAALAMIMWVMFGYSLAFGGDANQFISAGKLFLAGVTAEFDRRDLYRRRRYPRIRLHRLPDDLLGDHRRAGARRACRAHEILGGDGLCDRLAVDRLLPDRAHGLVSGRHRRSDRPDLRLGRARLCGRYRRPHQRGRCGTRRLPDHRQAQRLSERHHGAALADHDADRYRSAVGGLVRFQRRFGARSQWFGRSRADQHLHRHRRRYPVLDAHRTRARPQGVAARCLFGGDRRSGRGHPGRGQFGSVRRDPARRGRGCRLLLGRDEAEGQARL